jgi:large subunit ribosomal protein L9e
MKTILASQVLPIPDGVSEVTIKSRKVIVKGPRGTLTKDFRHLQCDIRKVGKKIRVDVWWGDRKHNACVNTVISQIRNMFTGVLKGYQYKMRFVYAHFPIGVNIPDDGKEIQIRNFLGERIVRRVPMLEGVTISRSENVKEEIVLTGNDVEKVSQSAAKIYESTRVKNKDIRKFLDGIYVSEKGAME